MSKHGTIVTHKDVDYEFTPHMPVTLVNTTFSDEMVCHAARLSTQGEDADKAATRGLIRRLMKDRHGSPFEHMNITFIVTAPLFVWREHHRHRIASYNEESARYRQLKPVFYEAHGMRPLTQVGKAMDYTTVAGTKDQYDHYTEASRQSAIFAYGLYQDLLDHGVMREVARTHLPLSIMSTCMVTMNARALMNFLSLRVKSDDSTFKSNPQWEINQIADKYENLFRSNAPITHEAFVEFGRVAP